MVIEANRCVTCAHPINDCPVPAKQIIVTACFHIYCLSCLKDWVKQLDKPCPLCRKDIYQEQSGKDFHVIWKIFMKIVKINPKMVFDSLQKKSGDKDCCSTCLDEFPKIPIEFDAASNRFKHVLCASESNSLKEITVKDIVGIVESYNKTDVELQKALTPKRPSILYKWITYFF